MRKQLLIFIPIYFIYNTLLSTNTAYIVYPLSVAVFCYFVYKEKPKELDNSHVYILLFCLLIILAFENPVTINKTPDNYIILCLLTPLTEEVIFRSFLLKDVKELSDPRAIISMMAFLMIHFNSFSHSLISLVIILTNTIILTNIRIESESIRKPAIYHVLWNVILLSL